MSIADRELAAFMSAVTELYGLEQGRISAEDWLDELESIDRMPESTTREWRFITIAASARLARRLAKAGRTGSCGAKSSAHQQSEAPVAEHSAFC